MKSPILLASIFAGCALQATAACSSSFDEPTATPEPDAGNTTLADAATDALPDASIDSPLDASMCSPVGWCPTKLPNSDFLVQDVWPFEDRAFAVGISPTLGVKVMEWTAATDSWSYIDDETQHASDLGDYIGTLWAPTENELYYTISPGYVYHGTRGAGMAWTWTRHQLPDNSPPSDNGLPNGMTFYIVPQNGAATSYLRWPALGVFGSTPDDVYAWFTNTIFHWKDDGSGTPAWVAEYTIEQPTTSGERTVILSAGASPTGEMWFAGARSYGEGWCDLVIRKSASGYTRIADGTIVNNACAAKPGFLPISGIMLNIQPTSTGRIFGLDYNKGVVEFLPGATDEAWSFHSSRSTFLGISNAYFSMWAPSDGEFWLAGDGIVVRGSNVLQDTGSWEISSIAENGAPIRSQFYRVRGTSTSNIWAVGNGYALHKTATP